MRNQNDEDNYDYSPNELADLSRNDPKKYQEVVQSNLASGDSVQRWEERNMEWAKKCLAEQRNRR